MVLLDKLLPKLQAEGHRVLLFSQFKGLLSLLVRTRVSSCVQRSEPPSEVSRHPVAS
jgi:hypothetical protein